MEMTSSKVNADTPAITSDLTTLGTQIDQNLNCGSIALGLNNVETAYCSTLSYLDN